LEHQRVGEGKDVTTSLRDYQQYWNHMLDPFQKTVPWLPRSFDQILYKSFVSEKDGNKLDISKNLTIGHDSSLLEVFPEFSQNFLCCESGSDVPGIGDSSYIVVDLVDDWRVFSWTNWTVIVSSPVNEVSEKAKILLDQIKGTGTLRIYAARKDVNQEKLCCNAIYDEELGGLTEALARSLAGHGMKTFDPEGDSVNITSGTFSLESFVGIAKRALLMNFLLVIGFKGRANDVMEIDKLGRALAFGAGCGKSPAPKPKKVSRDFWTSLRAAEVRRMSTQNGVFRCRECEGKILDGEISCLRHLWEEHRKSIGEKQ
jgi:hypothetical protein